MPVRKVPGVVALAALAPCLLLLAGCAAPDAGADGRTGHALEGRPLPAYHATDLEGNHVSLADHAGRPLLLHVWTSWCTVCEAEEPSLHRLHAQYGDRVDFVSVSVDDARTRDAMRAEAADGVGAQWWDPEDRVRPLLGVTYQPVTVFVAADGTVDAVWQGQHADRTTLRGHEELARTVLERVAAG